MMEADNTESNRQHKFHEVIDEILLDFVNSKLELYTKLSKPEVNADLKRELYQAYCEGANTLLNGKNEILM